MDELTRLHDVVIRTQGDDPELASGLQVDGRELLIPSGASIHVDISDAAATTITVSPSPSVRVTGVLVVPIGQHGVVRGRKDGRVMVHFGTQNQVEVWAWYDPADLLREPDMVEVVP